MSASTSRLTYKDAFELFDKALADPIGCRVKQKNSDKATYLRSRLHYARSRDREDNRATYEEGHPLHGRSAYDPITIQVQKIAGEWYVILRKVDSINYEVESLDGFDESDDSDNGTPEREKETTEPRRA